MAAGLSRGVRRTVLMLEELEDRVTPTLLGNQLFPADNPWNQKITNAPVAANSAAIMNNIISHYGDGRLHPDFGQDYHSRQRPLRHPVQRRPRQQHGRRSTSSSTPTPARATCRTRRSRPTRSSRATTRTARTSAWTTAATRT